MASACVFHFIFLLTNAKFLFVCSDSSFTYSTSEVTTKPVDKASGWFLPFIVILSIIGIALLLHCCWCTSLYCLILCRGICLHKQMLERQAKMPKIPYVILFKSQQARQSNSSSAKTSSSSASFAESPVTVNPNWTTDSTNEGYYEPQTRLI